MSNNRMEKKKRRTSWLKLTVECEKDKYETRIQSSKRLRTDTIATFLAELDSVRHQVLMTYMSEENPHIKTVERKSEGREYG